MAHNIIQLSDKVSLDYIDLDMIQYISDLFGNGKDITSIYFDVNGYPAMPNNPDDDDYEVVYADMEAIRDDLILQWQDDE